MSLQTMKQNRFKQRVWIRGTRPEEEEIFQFTMFQVCKSHFNTNAHLIPKFDSWLLIGRGLVVHGMVIG